MLNHNSVVSCNFVISSVTSRLKLSFRIVCWLLARRPHYRKDYYLRSDLFLMINGYIYRGRRIHASLRDGRWSTTFLVHGPRSFLSLFDSILRQKTTFNQILIVISMGMHFYCGGSWHYRYEYRIEMNIHHHFNLHQFTSRVHTFFIKLHFYVYVLLRLSSVNRHPDHQCD